MKKGQASATAIAGAAIRALEQTFPKKVRLFDDRFSHRFLPLQFRAIVACAHLPPVRKWIWNTLENKYPGALGDFLGRTALIDDFLKDAASTQIRQLIILGAGMDTRALRLKHLSKYRIVEIDHKDTQTLKKEKLRGLDYPASMIPADLSEIDWQIKKSIGTAIDWKQPCAILIEGVLPYLEEKRVKDLICDISRETSLGSRLFINFMDRKVFDGTWVPEGSEKMIQYVRNLGEPFRSGFSLNEMIDFMRPLGWRPIDSAPVTRYRETVMKNEKRNIYLNPGGLYIWSEKRES